MAQWIRPWSHNLEVPYLRLPAMAVVSLGKALFLCCLVLWRGLNPIPIGLFRGLESIGGGGGGGLIWPPPQISATNGPIDSKIGTVVKQVK